MSRAAAFFRWLSAQRDRDDPVGDLASDFVSESRRRQRLGEPPYARVATLWHDASGGDAAEALVEALIEFLDGAQ